MMRPDAAVNGVGPFCILTEEVNEMRVISWNLNGLLASLKNDVFQPIQSLAPDVLCLQEIRTHQEPTVLDGYLHIWNHGARDGYAGTAILCRKKPLRTLWGFDHAEEDNEGRVLTIELERCFIVNAYVPNSQQNLQRHAFRMEWDLRFHDYVCGLKEVKPVIICGDFNVARTELDIYPENLRQYWAEQGYASDERSNLETLIDYGFTDGFRHLHPSERSYTWWSNRLNKRSQNRGWRLDYFLIDDDLLPFVRTVNHLNAIMGSDHCPIELEVAL